MQTLLLPAAHSGTAASAPSPAMAAVGPSSHPQLHRFTRRPSLSNFILFSPSSLSSSSSISFVKPFQSHYLPLSSSLSSSSLSSYDVIKQRRSKISLITMASSPISQSDDSEKARLAQVSKRLESTSRNFKRFGNLGFWGQLVCTAVSAVILSFSVVVTGKVSSPATFYATAGGIAAAFISVFWSFGYIRLSERLRRTANDPSKAPPRADVVKSLKNGIVLNLLGMGAAILGMQATVGLLVAKALTTSANPYYQGIAPGSSPVLALDVFLVQASANTILSHFLGLVFTLELLRSVTVPSSESFPVPRVA